MTIGAYLASLIAAAIAAFVAVNVAVSRVSAIVDAVLLFCGLSLLLLLTLRRFDKTWYSARAVAESIKTRTWLYMMHAEPFASGEDPEVTRSEFLNDLREILKQNLAIAAGDSGRHCDADGIGAPVERVRQKSLEDRMEFYLNHRVRNQRQWYARKAAKLSTQARSLSLVLIAVNAGAIGLALWGIAEPGQLPVLPIPILVSVAGAVMAWLEARNLREQSAAYSMAAHEIGLIREQLGGLPLDETRFREFVRDAEMAFSREHTQWAARRSS